MPIFIHKYIDQIVDIKCDINNCYRAFSTLLGNEKENHTLVYQHLIKELKARKKSYKMIYKMIYGKKGKII